MEEISKQIIKELNKFQDKPEILLREIGVTIFHYLKGINRKYYGLVIKEIRTSNECTLHEKTIFESVRMVKKFPQMLDPKWKPMKGLTISHYKVASSYRLKPQQAQKFLQQASEQGITNRGLREVIRAFKGLDVPKDKEREALMKQLRDALRNKTSDQIRLVLEYALLELK